MSIFRVSKIGMAISTCLLVAGTAIAAPHLPSPNITAASGQKTGPRRLKEITSPFSPYALNYVLPYNYTTSPNQIDEMFPGQHTQNADVKFQFSVQSTLWNNILNYPLSLRLFYTQLSYWQAYAKSAYFRETNYNPGIFLRFIPPNDRLYSHLKSVDFGFMHESNGRGGANERSWNRTFLDFHIHVNRSWAIGVRPWLRINGFLENADYNPTIMDYMGYGDIRLSYRYKGISASLLLRNEMESDFKRGTEELDITFPLYNHLHGFLQAFSGYGQNLISFNHYTNAFGVGISLTSRESRRFK